MITAVVRDLAVFGNDFGGILSYCAFILCMVSACVCCPRRWCSGETSRFGCQVRYVRARRASDCDSLSGAHQNHGGPGFQFGIAVCSGNSSEDAPVFDTNFLRVNHVVKTRFPRAHGHRLLAVAPPASTPSPLSPKDAARRRRVDRAKDESVCDRAWFVQFAQVYPATQAGHILTLRRDAL